MSDSSEPRAPSESPARTGPPEGPYLQRHPKAKWALPGAIAVCAAGGVPIRLHCRGQVSTDDAQINGHLINISARVSGYVSKVCVEENQEVQEGAMLFQIAPSDLRVAVEKAHADLAQARTGARKASVQVPITSGAAASRGEEREAQADHWKAQRLWRWWSCR